MLLSIANCYNIDYLIWFPKFPNNYHTCMNDQNLYRSSMMHNFDITPNLACWNAIMENYNKYWIVKGLLNGTVIKHSTIELKIIDETWKRWHHWKCIEINFSNHSQHSFCNKLILSSMLINFLIASTDNGLGKNLISINNANSPRQNFGGGDQTHKSKKILI